MPLVKYKRNVDPSEGTGRILLGRDDNGRERALELGADPVEITVAEHAQLKGRYVLAEVDENGLEVEADTEDKVLDVSDQPSSTTSSASVSGTTSSPATLGASGHSLSTPGSGS